MTNLLHPRPWRISQQSSTTNVWIDDANGVPFLCVGPLSEPGSHDEAARIVAAVQPRDTEADFIMLPKVAWDDLVDRAADPTMAEGLPQSIHEVDRLIKRAVPGSVWSSMAHPAANGGVE